MIMARSDEEEQGDGQHDGTEQFVERHLKIGIDSLKQLINGGHTVRHLRF